ncbi:hypothetical protein [Actinomadura luteofluorescens]
MVERFGEALWKGAADVGQDVFDRDDVPLQGLGDRGPEERASFEEKRK